MDEIIKINNDIFAIVVNNILVKIQRNKNFVVDNNGDDIATRECLNLLFKYNLISSYTEDILFSRENHIYEVFKDKIKVSSNGAYNYSYNSDSNTIPKYSLCKIYDIEHAKELTIESQRINIEPEENNDLDFRELNISAESVLISNSNIINFESLKVKNLRIESSTFESFIGLKELDNLRVTHSTILNLYKHIPSIDQEVYLFRCQDEDGEILYYDIEDFENRCKGI